MNYPEPGGDVLSLLREGVVIPAHPLALTENRKLNEHRQRMLTRYYIEAGAGGIAVGVHTTQFEIRKPEHNLLEPVLKLASEELQAYSSNPLVRVAGITGNTANAVAEAKLAAKYGYDFGLLSNGGLSDYSESQLIERARKVAEIIPIFGFYLQPSVGGRILSYRFWRDFADIPNVYAIKIAAFNRYQTLDVVRAVCDCDRRDEVSLYTGNDDNIVADLLTSYRIPVGEKIVEKKFVGGLLGHWAVWTRKAVELLGAIKQRKYTTDEFLAKGVHITDMNAVIFDAANNFRGCIPGIHEILRRQGLLDGCWCLDPLEELSPGQMEEIDRICDQYRTEMDDEFVHTFLKSQRVSH
jgi:dihydrodipicolinate synthase/N-acetylneuraminate lyase